MTAEKIKKGLKNRDKKYYQPETAPPGLPLGERTAADRQYHRPLAGGEYALNMKQQRLVTAFNVCYTIKEHYDTERLTSMFWEYIL